MSEQVLSVFAALPAGSFRRAGELEYLTERLVWLKAAAGTACQIMPATSSSTLRTLVS